jgi:hypothetical protein
LQGGPLLVAWWQYPTTIIPTRRSPSMVHTTPAQVFTTLQPLKVLRTVDRKRSKLPLFLHHRFEAAHLSFIMRMAQTIRVEERDDHCR